MFLCGYSIVQITRIQRCCLGTSGFDEDGVGKETRFWRIEMPCSWVMFLSFLFHVIFLITEPDGITYLLSWYIFCPISGLVFLLTDCFLLPIKEKKKPFRLSWWALDHHIHFSYNLCGKLTALDDACESAAVFIGWLMTITRGQCDDPWSTLVM